MSNVSTARISSGSGSAPPSLTVSPMSSPMATTITRSPIPAIMACDSKHELQPAHRRCSRLNSMSDHSLGFRPSDFGLRISFGFRPSAFGFQPPLSPVSLSAFPPEIRVSPSLFPFNFPRFGPPLRHFSSWAAQLHSQLSAKRPSGAGASFAPPPALGQHPRSSCRKTLPPHPTGGKP